MVSFTDGDEARFSEQARKGWRGGRLSLRPGRPANRPLAAGLHWLGAGDGAAVLLVPKGLPADRLVPLVVLLHGATSNPEQALPYLQDQAAREGFLLLVPKSQGYTWDVIQGAFGPDVGVLDRALTTVFDHFPVDETRLGLAGFSDGASYALSLGLANGDLFSCLIAYSPGFVVRGSRVGRPAVFVCHGTHDEVLPIDRCSRRIVPVLREDGYQVDYREFPGGHELRPDLVEASVRLLVRSPA